MREGLLPATVTTVMTLDVGAAAARALTLQFGELFDPEETGVASFEDPATGLWRLEVYFAEDPDEAAVLALAAGIAGDAAVRSARFDRVAPRDWVAASLEGLKPVEAGRFVVHGAHDRAAARRRTSRIAIEIEAALAFGTGHHGTTRGCLLALDALFKTGRPRNVLDVGTGTGVLAIAAWRATHRPVVATDIDPLAVEVARGNLAANAARPVRLAVAPGLRHPLIAARRPYDLIVANILARPLVRLAPAIATALAAGGRVVLSGLLLRDVPGVLAAYRASGLFLARRIELEGWATLVLKRGGAGANPSPVGRRWPRSGRMRAGTHP